MSNLKAIYSGTFKNRARFDDGGYVSYATADPSAQYLTTNGSGQVLDASSGIGQAPTLSTGMSSAGMGGVSNALDGMQLSVPADQTAAMNANTASQSSGGASGALSKLLSAAGLGGGNASNTAILGALTGLLSAAGHYSQNKAGSTLPAMPALPGFSGTTSSNGAGLSSYGPPGGYNYKNYAGASSSIPGTGYAPRTQAPGKPSASYYTYGQGPEQQVFQQVQPGGGQIAPIPMAEGGSVPEFGMGGMMAQPGQTPMSPRPVQRPMPQQMGAPQQARPPQRPPSTMMARMQAARPMAAGGTTNTQTQAPGDIPRIAPNQMAQSQVIQTQNPHTLSNQVRRSAGVPAGPPAGAQPVIQQRATGGALSHANQSRHITGPGDGTSDSIPARLANGEFVVDSQAVSMLGNGSNEAGARKLEEFRKNLRQHKGGALARGKMAPDAKSIEHYMGGKV